MSKTKIAKKPATKAAKPTAKKPVATEAKGQSQFSGRKLFPKVKTNPRREGSHGFRSMGLIIAKPGIIYEDYLAAGGRNSDIRYDIAHGHCEARG